MLNGCHDHPSEKLIYCGECVKALVDEAIAREIKKKCPLAQKWPECDHDKGARETCMTTDGVVCPWTPVARPPMKPSKARVRMIWWKPWADRNTTRSEHSTVGDLAGVLQDVEAFLKEGRPVVLEPLEDPGEGPIPKGGA